MSLARQWESALGIYYLVDPCRHCLLTLPILYIYGDQARTTPVIFTVNV